MFGAIVVGVLVAMALLAVSRPGRRFLYNIGVYFGAQADRAAEQVAKSDPLGVYKTQIQNAIENGKNSNNSVALAAKQLISLDNQIANNMKEQTRLTNRIKSVHANGDPNKNIPKYAADLAGVEAQLKINQEQRATAQEQYDTNLKLVEQYEREVNAARKDAEHMGFQLQYSENEKEVRQMTASLKDGMNLGALAQARQRVQDQINENLGAAKASRDISRQTTSEEEDDKFEQDAAAQAIMDRLGVNS